MLLSKKSNLDIVYIKIEKIIPWKENPRKNSLAVPKLVEIIKKYGLRSPLNLWSKNMVVYKGNTTLQALKKLGYEVVPCILHDFKNEEEAIKYGLADNKASEWSVWDEEKIYNIFANKKIDITDSFTNKEIERLENVFGEGVQKERHIIKKDSIVISFDMNDEFEAAMRKKVKSEMTISDFIKLIKKYI